MKRLKTEISTKNPEPAIRNSQHGFSLVELMIALLITALVMAGVYTTFVVQQRSFIAQDQVTETQGSSKIAFDMIVNDIRNAGYGYPDDEAPDINGSTAAIEITPGTNGTDTITLVGGFRDIATLAATTNAGDNTISITYSGSTKFNKSNKNALSIDGVNFAFIIGCTLDADNNCDDKDALTLDRPVDKAFPVDRPVYLIEDVTYRLNGTDLQRVSGSSAAPPPTLAENIEDLQFVPIDQNADGNTDRIRVSLLARTATEDPTIEPNTKPYFPRIDLEDNTTSVNDRYRRRIWSMEVALKN